MTNCLGLTEGIEVVMVPTAEGTVPLAVGQQLRVAYDSQGNFFSPGDRVFRGVQSMDGTPTAPLWIRRPYLVAPAAQMVVGLGQRLGLPALRCVRCHKIVPYVVHGLWPRYQCQRCFDRVEVTPQAHGPSLVVEDLGHQLVLANEVTIVPPDAVPLKAWATIPFKLWRPNEPQHPRWCLLWADMLTFLWEVAGLHYDDARWPSFYEVLRPAEKAWNAGQWEQFQAEIQKVKERVRYAPAPQLYSPWQQSSGCLQ